MSANNDLRPKRTFTIDPNALCSHRYSNGIRCRGIRIKGTETCPGHTEGMECGFILPSGKRCWLRAARGELFCGMHIDLPKVLPVEAPPPIIRSKDFISKDKTASSASSAPKFEEKRRIRLNKKEMTDNYAGVEAILPYTVIKRSCGINTPCFLAADLQKFTGSEGEYFTSWKRRMATAAGLREDAHFLTRKQRVYISFGGAKRVLRTLLKFFPTNQADAPIVKQYKALLRAIKSKALVKSGKVQENSIVPEAIVTVAPDLSTAEFFIPATPGRLPSAAVEKAPAPVAEKPNGANGKVSATPITNRIIGSIGKIVNDSNARDREASAERTQMLRELQGINDKLLKLLKVWGG